MAKTKLPALPDQPRTATPEQLAALPARVGATLPTINDLAELKEWMARADALAEYLRTHDLHRPMLGVQRRIEARIGQLLSPPGEGPTPADPQRAYEAELFPHKQVRRDFRWLAKALDGDVAIPNEDWWERSRSALVHAIRQELDALPKRRAANAHQAVQRRRRRRPPPNDGERGEWLLNAVANSGAAAELAADLAAPDTIRSLSAQQCDTVLEGVNLARVYLQRVARGVRHHGKPEKG